MNGFLFILGALLLFVGFAGLTARRAAPAQPATPEPVGTPPAVRGTAYTGKLFLFAGQLVPAHIAVAIGHAITLIDDGHDGIAIHVSRTIPRSGPRTTHVAIAAPQGSPLEQALAGTQGFCASRDRAGVWVWNSNGGLN